MKLTTKIGERVPCYYMAVIITLALFTYADRGMLPAVLNVTLGSVFFFGMIAIPRISEHHKNRILKELDGCIVLMYEIHELNERMIGKILRELNDLEREIPYGDPNLSIVQGVREITEKLYKQELEMKLNIQMKLRHEPKENASA